VGHPRYIHNVIRVDMHHRIVDHSVQHVIDKEGAFLPPRIARFPLRTCRLHEKSDSHVIVVRRFLP